MNVSSVKNLNGEVFSAVQDASLTNVVQTNSGNWQDITAYQNTSATYLTAHQDLSDYYTTADANTLSSMLSGAIDYVSANAGDEFPISADEAIQYVQTNSAGIDETITNVTTNSASWGSAGITGVSHDNTLRGNGTVDSPLGIVNPLPYPVELVATSGAATGANILYVVTGTGE